MFPGVHKIVYCGSLKEKMYMYVEYCVQNCLYLLQSEYQEFRIIGERMNWSCNLS
jgi:hypothetical protein